MELPIRHIQQNQLRSPICEATAIFTDARPVFDVPTNNSIKKIAGPRFVPPEHGPEREKREPLINDAD